MLAVNQAVLSLRLRLRRSHLPRQREARKPGEALRWDTCVSLYDKRMACSASGCTPVTGNRVTAQTR